jgi:hypothetical protein
VFEALCIDPPRNKGLLWLLNLCMVVSLSERDGRFGTCGGLREPTMDLGTCPRYCLWGAEEMMICES